MMSDICFFTGHRIIAAKEKAVVKENIKNAIIYLMHEKGVTNFISGGALGFDTMAAQTVLKLKETYKELKLIMYLPCNDQDKRWTPKDRSIYRYILKYADECVLVSNSGYTDGCMKERNLAMARDSSFCIAYYKGRVNSGTGQSVRFAKENDCMVINTANTADMRKIEYIIIKARINGIYDEWKDYDYNDQTDNQN